MVPALIRTLRPKQWVKNGFIFAALIFDRQLTNTQGLLQTVAGFTLFCMISSAVYIINDLVDLDADRRHPKKRLRPLAAGQLPVIIGWITAVGLVIVTLPLALVLSPGFAGLALFYFTLNLLYSIWLKHIPLLDVLILASFYVIRVGAGVALIEVERFSPWLYVFTTFLALYLGIGKRRAELTLLAESANEHRRVFDGYTIPFLDQLIIIVSSMTIITYSLYTFSAPNLPENHTMMLTIPFVIYGIFRYLHIVQVKKSGGEPVEVLFSDRPLQVALGLWGIAVIVIFYVLSVR